jgi:hypothetical protein
MSVFNVLGTIGKLALPSLLKFWTCGKPSLGWRDMLPRTEATEVFLVRQKAFFWSRFRLDRGKSWRFKSSTQCLNISSFSWSWVRGSHFSESERIFAQAWHLGGENYEIFSIVLFHWSVFVRVVDVAPNVGFWRSWCRWKACATFFLKVPGLRRGELGFARYDPANTGCWSVSHVGGLSSDRDSSLTRGALDNPRVTRCGWSYPLP